MSALDGVSEHPGASADRRFAFRPRVTPLGRVPDAGELLARLDGHRSRAALDSAGGAPRRWSLVAFDPLAAPPPAAPLDRGALRAYVASLATPERSAQGSVPGPFHGGFVGALAYDLGVAGERALRLPRDPWGTPLVAGGLYVDFVVRDEASGEGWLVLGDEPGDARAPIGERRARVLAEVHRPAASVATRATTPLERKTPRAEHMARVEALRESIAAGDLYQANLAHRFECSVEGRPVDLYRALRAANPGPYMGYLEWDAATSARAGELARGALLSASPELLLEVRAEDGVRVARTRPIKGTAPRGRTDEEDRSLARALLASEKDRAELAMIVDLERNDLGRVARVGTVRVERFPSLESYASVHHLVADVVAELGADRDAFDALGALFPGGSITGAPKVASMRRIAELEREGRGFFTGTLGFADVRGDAAFNVLIRTLVWRPRTSADADRVAFHVGGGITWASDAAAEDRETLAKGAALARALGVEGFGR